MTEILCYIFIIISFVLSCTFLTVFATKIPFYRKYKLIQKLPGPKGVILLGNILQLMAVPPEDILFWLNEKVQNHERLMRLWFGTTSCVCIKDPDDAQALFSSIKHINKGIHYITLKPWLEEGLLTSTKDKWHLRRKLLTPAFHFKILEDNVCVFNNCSKILCNKLEKTQEKEVDITSYVTLCTLDAIMATAMGINLNTQLEGGKEYIAHLKQVRALTAKRIVRPLLFINWIYMLTTGGQKFYKLVKYLHDFSFTVIKERKKVFNPEKNSLITDERQRAFLDQLLQYEMKNPKSFSDKDIREEVDTFMFEGHDTTSVALVHALYALAIHTDVQEKVYQEMKVIFGSSDRDVTSNDLHKMVYLEKVIKETLRLYPSVPGVSRNLDHDLILNDGVIIPAGTNVMALIYMVHRNEKYWEEPEKFDPERFSDEQISSRHPYAYIPFSAGPRNCIGKKFAMMELKTVLSIILRRLQVVLLSNRDDVKFTFNLVLRTMKPIMCKFILR